MPDLDTPYAPNHRWVLLAAIDEIPMNDPPPPRTISRAECLSTYMVPLMFRSTVRRHSLGVDLGDGADRLAAAGAVHDAVQPAGPRGGRLDDPAHLVFVGDVGGLVEHRRRRRRPRP